MVPPINALPAEILAHIFSESTRFCSERTHRESALSILNPITFASICKHWRQIALDHRSLWTHIDLVVNVMDDGRYHSPDIWIEHSKGAPLFVHVYQPQSHTGDYKAAEEESSNALSGVKRDLAPMVSRLVDFLSPLVPQINSLIASILWPYQSTLTTLTDLWALCGTPDHAKVLKVRAHPDLPELKVRSLPSYKLFFESLEVLHLLNACLAWSEFSFGNLIELRIETWRGEWSMASSELASVLASCPRLQHLAPHHPQTEIASATNPKPALLADLQTLELGGLSYLSREGTTLLELILATINPGQNALRASISLRHLVGPSQRALDAIGAFVCRSNMATLRIYYPGLSEMSGYPLYFASQLGPLPRVQTLALDNWCFCDSLKVDQMFGRIKTYENPRPINPDRVLWPQLQNLYLNWCNLEAGHLNQLISLHSIQSLFIRNCYDWCDPQSPFDSGTPTSKQFVQMLSAVVPRIVHFSNARGSWLPFMNLVPPRL